MTDKDILYVIDLDRTLIGFDQVMGLTEKACAKAGIGFAPIKQQQLKASAEAQPYSPLSTIANSMGAEKLTRFNQAFLEANPEELIFEDAQRYLDKLKQAGHQHMILTYAVEAEWQEIKLQAAKLSKIPHVITFTENKSQEIAKWLDDEGKFTPPLATINPASRIVFIDDRPRVFKGMPDNCEGFLVDRFGYAEKENLPERVTRIKTFDDIIDKI
ncbi:MAG TPA: hypothetical protein VD947_00145 [Patescibacteria group bacterium]|nr:hypothetical protein [Patescibacteria group bacterium]